MFISLVATISFLMTPLVSTTMCLYQPVPIERTVERIGDDAVMISGTLIQAFDANSRKSEVFRADVIHIGNGQPRDFAIHRTDWEFGPFRTSCSQLPLGPERLGQKFERLVLLPARDPENPMANGRWFISYAPVRHGRGLELLIERAREAGRLQSTPPAPPEP